MIDEKLLYTYWRLVPWFVSLWIEISTHVGQFAHNLEQHHVSLDHERNRINHLEFKSVTTRIYETWDELPAKSNGVLNNLYQEKIACAVGYPVELIDYDVPEGTLCLFKDEMDLSIFLNEVKIVFQLWSIGRSLLSKTEADQNFLI